MLPLPPGYNLIRVVHEGALASVYLVEAASSGGGRFALKVLDLGEVADRLGEDAAGAHAERFRSAYERQGELAKAAPGAWAGVRSIGQRDRTAFVLLEHMPTSAGVLIQRKAPVGHGVLAAVGAALVEGLLAAWAGGGACGNVKGGNVLVDEGSKTRAPAARLTDPDPASDDAATTQARNAELRAAAGIVHGLIAHRPLSEMLTSVQPGEGWERLGGKAAFWANVCNTLLDESAFPVERLERLRGELGEVCRQSRARAKGATVRRTAAIAAGVVLGVGVLGAAGVWGVSNLGGSGPGGGLNGPTRPAGADAWEAEAEWLTPLVVRFAREDAAWTRDPRVAALREALWPAVEGTVAWHPAMVGAGFDPGAYDPASLGKASVPAGVSEADVQRGRAFAAEVRGALAGMAFVGETRGAFEAWRARGWSAAVEDPGVRVAVYLADPASDPVRLLPELLRDHERAVSIERDWADIGALVAGPDASGRWAVLAAALRDGLADALAGLDAESIVRWFAQMPSGWRAAFTLVSMSAFEQDVLGLRAALAIHEEEPDARVVAGAFAVGTSSWGGHLADEVLHAWPGGGGGVGMPWGVIEAIGQGHQPLADDVGGVIAGFVGSYVPPEVAHKTVVRHLDYQYSTSVLPRESGRRKAAGRKLVAELILRGEHDAERLRGVRLGVELVEGDSVVAPILALAYLEGLGVDQDLRAAANYTGVAWGNDAPPIDQSRALLLSGALDASEADEYVARLRRTSRGSAVHAGSASAALAAYATFLGNDAESQQYWDRAARLGEAEGSRRAAVRLLEAAREGSVPDEAVEHLRSAAFGGDRIAIYHALALLDGGRLTPGQQAAIVDGLASYLSRALWAPRDVNGKNESLVRQVRSSVDGWVASADEQALGLLVERTPIGRFAVAATVAYANTLGPDRAAEKLALYKQAAPHLPEAAVTLADWYWTGGVVEADRGVSVMWYEHAERLGVVYEGLVFDGFGLAALAHARLAEVAVYGPVYRRDPAEAARRLELAGDHPAAVALRERMRRDGRGG